MEITKDSVKEWLSAHRRQRSWLAEKCGASTKTINNWLSTDRGIPSKAVMIIQKLMEEDALADQAKPPHNLVLEFDDDEYEPIEKAALNAQRTVRDWAKRTLNDIASESVEEIAAKIAPFHSRTANIMAAAGPGIAAEVIDWDQGDRVRVKIVGDSMAPLFEDGQVIEMRHKKASRSPYMKKGMIYLVELDGEWMVKRYGTRKPRKDESGAEYLTTSGSVGVLKSENPEFPDIDITGPFEWAAWYDEDSQ